MMMTYDFITHQTSLNFHSKPVFETLRKVFEIVYRLKFFELIEIRELEEMIKSNCAPILFLSLLFVQRFDASFMFNVSLNSKEMSAHSWPHVCVYFQDLYANIQSMPEGPTKKKYLKMMRQNHGLGNPIPVAGSSFSFILIVDSHFVFVFTSYFVVNLSRAVYSRSQFLYVGSLPFCFQQ